MLAIDYVENWEGHRPAKSPALAEVWDRVGAEIVHLSVSRLDVGPEAKNWNVAAIRGALNDVVEVFVQQNPKDYRPSGSSARPLSTTGFVGSTAGTATASPFTDIRSLTVNQAAQAWEKNDDDMGQ